VPYVHELVTVAGIQQAVIAALAETLPTINDYWHLGHPFEMGLRLAMDGVPGARQVVYSAYRDLVDRWSPSGPATSARIEVARPIIECDGLEGAIFVFGELGRRAQIDATYHADDELLELARTSVGSATLDEALDRARATDPRIDAYLRVEEEWAASRKARSGSTERPPHPLQKLSWPEAKEAIARQVRGTGQSGFGWQSWGRRASAADLELAARALRDLPVDDVGLLRPYLSIFANRTFPFDPQPLIALIDDPRDKVAWFALNALRRIQHPSVRAAALRMAAEGPLRQRAVGLLAANWESGDEQLVEKLLREETDRQALHHLGMGLRDVIEGYGSPTLVPALLVGYERTPCSLCREAYVKELIRLDELPAALRLECRWDARAETRDLVS
jgi:hypothetical protein